MKNFWKELELVVFGCLMLLFWGGVISVCVWGIVFNFRIDPELFSRKIDGLPALIAQVEAAAKAGDAASPLKGQSCMNFESSSLVDAIQQSLTGQPGIIAKNRSGR